MLRLADRRHAARRSVSDEPLAGGEVVTEAYTIVLPNDTPPGEYALEVGLYRAETGARLPVAINGQAAGDAARLTPLLIGP